MTYSASLNNDQSHLSLHIGLTTQIMTIKSLPA